MKILFIQPPAGFLMRGTTYPVCRSMMVTASYLKSLGYEVQVFDRCVDFRKADKVIEGFRPDFVMIYITPTASLKDAIEDSKSSKKCGAYVVWSEVVASAIAEDVVRNGFSDFVITGETESKFFSLIEETNGSKNFVSIPGLTYCKDGKVVTTKNENNSNLIDLPPIDWDLIDVKKCFRSFPHCNRMLYMYTSRGCPFKCAYCYNTMFYNSQHRKRPIGYVLDEILYLEKTYNLDGVNFSDELLLLSDEEINQISEFRKKNNLKFFWGGETRTDIYDLSQLKKMYEAGCRWLMLGIETGSETTRKQINKIMDQEQIKSFIDMCTQAGITTFGSFIIGFPDETPEQLKETAQFALSLGLDAFLFNYYVAIPKTPLGDKLIAAGKFTTEEVINQAAASSKLQCLTDNYSAISDKELLVVKSYFDWLTFTRKKKESAQKRMFIKKAFDVLKHSADGGFSRAFYNLFDAGKTFITVLYYSHAYPHIIRKYGLYNVNKK